MLERYAMKVARTVLRGGGGSNASPLPDRLIPRRAPGLAWWQSALFWAIFAPRVCTALKFLSIPGPVRRERERLGGIREPNFLVVKSISA
jgi:hypothetical protein